jgi:hypothetical protein
MTYIRLSGAADLVLVIARTRPTFASPETFDKPFIKFYNFVRLAGKKKE